MVHVPLGTQGVDGQVHVEAEAVARPARMSVWEPAGDANQLLRAGPRSANARAPGPRCSGGRRRGTNARGPALRERRGSYHALCTKSERPEGESDDHINGPGHHRVPGTGRRSAHCGDHDGRSWTCRSVLAGEPAVLTATEIAGFVGAGLAGAATYPRLPTSSGPAAQLASAGWHLRYGWWRPFSPRHARSPSAPGSSLCSAASRSWRPRSSCSVRPGTRTRDVQAISLARPGPRQLPGRAAQVTSQVPGARSAIRLRNWPHPPGTVEHRARAALSCTRAPARSPARPGKSRRAPNFTSPTERSGHDCISWRCRRRAPGAGRRRAQRDRAGTGGHRHRWP